MNYIGSKKKLAPFITYHIEKIVGNLENKVFAEIFAGTGIIARKFKGRVKSIIANDFEYYSYVLLRNYIENHKLFEYDNLFNELNSIEKKEGFIFKNYCLGGGTERNYFSDENGMLIDAMRKRIEEWKDSNYIANDEYFFLLASLLEASDKVANTASVYGAFLNHIKKSAQKRLFLAPALFGINEGSHKVYNEDANSLINNIEGDILYLDPPYNHRQYGANYHLLNTIALYDKFLPKGKTGLREYKRSNYCIKDKVLGNFEQLIKNAQFEYIFLSYNNEGVLSLEKIKETMKKYGKYSLTKTENYQRFKADRDENRNYIAEKTTEYLHILEKE